MLLLYHLEGTNFESDDYYDNIDDKFSQKLVTFISAKEQNSPISDILYSSSPPTINPYETRCIKILSTESELKDPTYMKTVSSDSDVEDPYYSIPADELKVNLNKLTLKPNKFHSTS